MFLSLSSQTLLGVVWQYGFWHTHTHTHTHAHTPIWVLKSKVIQITKNQENHYNISAACNYSRCIPTPFPLLYSCTRTSMHKYHSTHELIVCESRPCRIPGRRANTPTHKSTAATGTGGSRWQSWVPLQGPLGCRV